MANKKKSNATLNVKVEEPKITIPSAPTKVEVQVSEVGELASQAIDAQADISTEKKADTARIFAVNSDVTNVIDNLGVLDKPKTKKVVAKKPKVKKAPAKAEKKQPVKVKKSKPKTKKAVTKKPEVKKETTKVAKPVVKKPKSVKTKKQPVKIVKKAEPKPVVETTKKVETKKVQPVVERKPVYVQQTRLAKEKLFSFIQLDKKSWLKILLIWSSILFLAVAFAFTAYVILNPVLYHDGIKGGGGIITPLVNSVGFWEIRFGQTNMTSMGIASLVLCSISFVCGGAALWFSTTIKAFRRWNISILSIMMVWVVVLATVGCISTIDMTWGATLLLKIINPTVLNGYNPLHYTDSGLFMLWSTITVAIAFVLLVGFMILIDMFCFRPLNSKRIGGVK